MTDIEKTENATEEVARDIANFAALRREFGQGLGADTVSPVEADTPGGTEEPTFVFYMKLDGREYAVRVKHLIEHDVPEEEEA